MSLVVYGCTGTQNSIKKKDARSHTTHIGPIVHIYIYIYICVCVCVCVCVYVYIEYTSYETTPETLTNSHCSLGMRPQQDYTHPVMLNNYVSARWGLIN